ncbi:uncharacterized protein LACBIDRAFT_295379 [Laccaria bicolor S238N-H82]|uniref:Predicted protein n=1 Tax=Laccaria bicolor (strain S238N-H82 / ATCC MYA-4686) TaxID=486041 RepID=B0DRK4_LACBS|nr:uncharacterized protein LACBIDRAFT_295379 [Laccaria bicolor S238N-H82]EDR02800.1 predicted protein [Laccaria bicolor S238N-H82]|eukprot:XP_001886510.1 predicted protein [Laccaria bicolor S238N-H82]
MSTISDLIEEVKVVTDIVESMRLVTYFDVAGATMFLYDYLLTLGMEVELVWSSKGTFMKVLYFAQRYLPFVDAVALCLLNQLSTAIDPRACKMVEKARGFVLTLRVWAVWERSSRVGLALSILFFLAVSSNFVVSGFFLGSLKCCFITSASRVVYMNWVLLMVYEADRIAGDTALHTVVYRDGVLIYIYLFGKRMLYVSALLYRSSTALSTINVIHIYLDILWSVLLDIRAYGSKAHIIWADGIIELHLNSQVATAEPKLATRWRWARIWKSEA